MKEISQTPPSTKGKLSDKKILQYFSRFIERFDAIKFVLHSQKEELTAHRKEISALKKEVEKISEKASGNNNKVVERIEKIDKAYKKLKSLFGEHSSHFSKEHKDHKKQLHLLKHSQNLLTEKVYSPSDRSSSFERKDIPQNKDANSLLEKNNEESLEVKKFVKTSLKKLSEKFENMFHTELLAFDRQLKEKEENLTTKIISLEEERSNISSQFQKYKQELLDLTKEQKEKLNKDFDKIETEDKKLIQKQQDIFKEIEKHSNNIFTSHIQQIKDFLEEQKKQHNAQEDSFKSLFSQKINNLHTYFDDKIQDIEEKFIDKNTPILEEKLKTEFKKIEDTQTQINSQNEEFSKKLNFLKEEHDEKITKIVENEKERNKKTEEGLNNLEEKTKNQIEKQELKFSKLKLGIVKETEELVKDVGITISGLVEDFRNSVLNLEKEYREKLNEQDLKISNSILEIEKTTSEKMEILNTSLKDLFFNISHLKGSLRQIIGIERNIEGNIKMLEKKYNTLKEKFENINVFVDLSHIKQFCYTMASYEKKLYSLISTLKLRKVPEDEIERVLTLKGHPKLYVRIILATHNKIYKKY